MVAFQIEDRAPLWGGDPTPVHDSMLTIENVRFKRAHVVDEDIQRRDLFRYARLRKGLRQKRGGILFRPEERETHTLIPLTVVEKRKLRLGRIGYRNRHIVDRVTQSICGQVSYGSGGVSRQPVFVLRYFLIVVMTPKLVANRVGETARSASRWQAQPRLNMDTCPCISAGLQIQPGSDGQIVILLAARRRRW
jgi:hypothetical protein